MAEMTEITVKKLELTTMQGWHSVVETVITVLLEKMKRAQPMEAAALSMEIQKWYAMECGIEPALTNAATRELVRELEQRLGVEKVVVNPYEKKKVAVEGAAIVLVVTD